MTPATALLRRASTVGALLAVGLTAHTVVNVTRMRRPPAPAPPVRERVSVLLPARDEAHRIAPTIVSLLNQQGVPDLQVLVLDDGSGDGTADVVRDVAAGDPRLRVLSGADLPAGWLGKPHACHQLASQAEGSVLCFVDADVVLAPHALASAVTLLRESGLDLVSPYPRQLTSSLGPRLVQPLIEWSWLTTLPLGVAERSSRPSLSAATGQFLVVDADAYRRAGGHAAVRADVLDDVALLRAVKVSGGHGVAVDGSRLATCQMYDSWADLTEGYTKSLWRAFGGTAGATGVAGLFTLVYLVPPAAAVLTGARSGWVGYAAAVAGRVVVARAVGQPVWPDTLAHPVAIGAFVGLTGTSVVRHRRGTLRWKGRPVA